MQTIQCPRCQHKFDTPYKVHCICKGCRASISIPDARRNYVAHVQPQAGSVRVTAPLPPSVIAPKPGSANDLPPVVRDDAGQPLKQTTVNRGDTPRHDDDFFAQVARRAKEIAKETAERVAAGGPIEEPL